MEQEDDTVFGNQRRLSENFDSRVTKVSTR